MCQCRAGRARRAILPANLRRELARVIRPSQASLYRPGKQPTVPVRHTTGYGQLQVCSPGGTDRLSAPAGISVRCNPALLLGIVRGYARRSTLQYTPCYKLTSKRGYALQSTSQSELIPKYSPGGLSSGHTPQSAAACLQIGFQRQAGADYNQLLS